MNFINLNMQDLPAPILKNAEGKALAVLGAAYNIQLDVNYNEVSTLEFELPARVDGMDVPYYDDVVGMRMIELPGLARFTLIAPEETDDGISRIKSCKAYSLEYEFAYKNITLANDTYKFWDLNTDVQGDSVLGMIMELMPSWSIGAVPLTIMNRYRTFEVSNDNLFNFMKGTLQQSYGCIFEFDTLNRTVTVRDIDDAVAKEPVYISTDNLAKSITISENAEDIVTRLDVSGADGVDIRDVNPTGTNSIINLDYFMTPKNFDSALIQKYQDWKSLCESRRSSYYSQSVQYGLLIMQRNTEQARLIDLQGELTNIDNQRAVTMQAISEGLRTQSHLDAINVDYRAKQAEVDAQKTVISSLETELATALQGLQEIVSECSYSGYFTEAERMAMDKYIKDGSVSESSFVANAVDTYSDGGATRNYTDAPLRIENATITQTDTGSETIYDLRGGDLTVGEDFGALIISAVISVKADDSVMMTAYLSKVDNDGSLYPTGCVSITGTAASRSINTTTGVVSMTVSGYSCFTANPSEYEKRSIAWELYEYGEKLAEKMSQPTFSFEVDSANFLALEEFDAFRNKLRLGEKIYLETSAGVLTPILIGASVDFGDLPELTLKFGNTYVSSDTAFKLADLLEQSVSAGRTVDAGKFNYESFVSSGAMTDIRNYMESALDVAKNAILSSTDQAITWDGAGLKLRRRTSGQSDVYDDEQIWLNNNSILMTDDNWTTAKMAIGKFHDVNLGDLWGIIAPMIVGTLIAGETLMIESEKKAGGKSVFTVDGDGARMINGDIAVIGEGGSARHVVISPQVGIVIGKYPVVTEDANGNETINSANASFWVDQTGKAYFAGDLSAANGTFSGTLSAADGTFTGTLRGVDGTFSGTLSGASGSFSGSVQASALYIGDGANRYNIVAARGKVGDASSKNYWDLENGQFVTQQGQIGPFTINQTGLYYTAADGKTAQLSDTQFSFQNNDTSGIILNGDGVVIRGNTDSNSAFKIRSDFEIVLEPGVESYNASTGQWNQETDDVTRNWSKLLVDYSFNAGATNPTYTNMMTVLRDTADRTSNTELHIKADTILDGGCLTIDGGYYPATIVKPGRTGTNGMYNYSVFSGDYHGSAMMQAWTGTTGETRRILRVASSASSNLDNAIALIVDDSGTQNTYKVFHSGMSNAIPVSNGGTGITTNPSMLVDVSQTSSADVFTTYPRPGVTGTLKVGNGGTGITSNPSLLVNLNSTSSDNVFQYAPRPGVTGTLNIANGGTGGTTAAEARANLGITAANLGITADSLGITASSIGAVSKSGDTMTGDLIVQGAVHARNSSYPTFEFDNGNGTFVATIQAAAGSSSGGQLTFRSYSGSSYVTYTLPGCNSSNSSGWYSIITDWNLSSYLTSYALKSEIPSVSGWSGTFTTADERTVTVSNGLITSVS